MKSGKGRAKELVHVDGEKEVHEQADADGPLEQPPHSLLDVGDEALKPGRPSLSEPRVPHDVQVLSLKLA